ncbi:MAG: YgjV family protein [Atopobiaceae bacterium]|nr:YgjV family protein [Atopobiaceae bacterium]
MAVEILGTVASLCVLGSFLLNGEMSIRSANIVGALLFVIYGIIIKSFSITLCNAALIVVHLVKFVKMRKQQQSQAGR